MNPKLITAFLLMATVSHGQPRGPVQDLGPITAVTPDLAPLFGFEGKHTSLVPEGWQAPGGGVKLDRFGAHDGKWGVRLDAVTGRGGRSATTSLTQTLKGDFQGKYLEFRAYLRTENVTNATLRLDLFNSEQREVARYVMLGGSLQGTVPWREGIVRIPLTSGVAFARLWVFSQAGTTWVDDIRLLVDGKPAWETAKPAAAPRAP